MLLSVVLRSGHQSNGKLDAVTVIRSIATAVFQGVIVDGHMVLEEGVVRVVHKGQPGDAVIGFEVGGAGQDAKRCT